MGEKEKELSSETVINNFKSLIEEFKQGLGVSEKLRKRSFPR